MDLPGNGFRELYLAIIDEPAEDGFQQRLWHGAGHATARLAGLTEWRRRGPRHVPGDQRRSAQLWELYALSRVGDFLLERGCPAGEPTGRLGVTGGRTLDRPALACYADFQTRIGLEGFAHDQSFSPFHHEIFAVVPDESLTEVVLEEVLWPGFRFGDLLIARAGALVRAPGWLVDPMIATTSPLFFTHRRAPRRTADLADGWGSQSQWRTNFRRFYEDRSGLHFNWDGEVDIGSDLPPPREDSESAEEDGPVAERRELLLHRCLVRSRPGEFDPYPYDDRLSVTWSGWPLDPDAIIAD